MNSTADVPISVEDVMALLTHIARVEDLKIAYKHSRWGATIAGASALVGGMMAGPPGIFIGKCALF